MVGEKSLLLIDDDAVDRELVKLVLGRDMPDLQVTEVKDAVGFGEALGRGDFGIVITECKLRWGDGVSILSAVKARKPACPVIMFTTTGCEEMAVQAMRLGLDDYVLKSHREFLHLPGTLQQVIERGRSTRQPRSLELALQAALEQSETGSFRATPEGTLLEANSVMLRMMGVTTLDAARQSRLRDLFALSDTQQPAWALLQKTAHVRCPEAQLLRANGFRLWVSLTMVLVPWEGNEHQVFGLVTDIGPQRGVKEELVARAEDLARSNTELEQFAYVAAHELQEPLRMVARYSKMIADRYGTDVGADGARFLGYVVEGTDRMQRLIDDLLKYTRITTRGGPMARTDAESALETAVQYLRAGIERCAAVVTHDALPAVSADEGQLTQLFENLISNAIKFRSNEPPRIHISARNEDGYWVFGVRDNGVGIGSADQGRIFDIFYRVPAPSKEEGTGIGLAVCKKIVERHGGRIWVEPNAEGGSTFYFSLPGSGQ